MLLHGGLELAGKVNLTFPTAKLLCSGQSVKKMEGGGRQNS